VHSVAGCLYYGAYATALTTLLWLAAAGFAIGALIALHGCRPRLLQVSCIYAQPGDDE
jgi:hypothetical protein